MNDNHNPAYLNHRKHFDQIYVIQHCQPPLIHHSRQWEQLYYIRQTTHPEVRINKHLLFS